MTEPDSERPPELVRYLKLSEIADAGAERSIEANPPELKAIAARLGLPSMQALSADLSVGWADGRGLLRVTGMIQADVTYECVVTLEPFGAHLEVAVDEAFDPAAPADRDEVELADLDQADAPEPLRGNRLDLGETVVQCLSLALDPHPRRPGVGVGQARFGDTDTRGEDRPNPFAVLERLKRDR